MEADISGHLALEKNTAETAKMFMSNVPAKSESGSFALGGVSCSFYKNKEIAEIGSNRKLNRKQIYYCLFPYSTVRPIK